MVAVGIGCPPGNGPGGAERQRFEAVSPGVVHDTQTGLEWTAGDAGLELAWPAAAERCAELATGEHGPGWRLPEIGELAGLYDPTEQRPCGGETCRVDPSLRLTSPYLWSRSSPGQGRRSYFDFRFGSRLSPRIRPDLTRRALCTRHSPAIP